MHHISLKNVVHKGKEPLSIFLWRYATDGFIAIGHGFEPVL